MPNPILIATVTLAALAAATLVVPASERDALKHRVETIARADGS